MRWKSPAIGLLVGALSIGLMAVPAAAATPPGRPGSFSVTSGNGRVTATWTAPASHGARITKYQVASSRYSDAGFGTWSAFRTVTVPAGTRSRAVLFPNGAFVAVKVRAYNSRGWGPWTTATRLTVGLPARVPGTRVTSGDARATITWSAASGNGSPVTQYWIYKRSFDAGRWTEWSDYVLPATARSSVARGLLNGVAYQFYVVARNKRGFGPPGTIVSARPVAPPDTQPPGPVSSVAVTDRTTTSIALSWDNPTDPDLSSIIVRRAVGSVAPASPSSGAGVVLASATASTVTDVGLVAGTTYSYAVFSRDTRGNTTTPPATITTSTLAAPDTTAPSPVSGLVVGARTQSTVALSWLNPADADLASVLVRRTVGAVPAATATDGTAVALASPTATTVIDSGLAAGTTYSYSLFTRDSSGNTSTVAVSATTSTAPDETPPGPVANLQTGVITASSVQLTWTNPPDADLAALVIRRAAGSVAPATPSDGTAVAVVGPGTTYTDTGLTAETTYSYAVFARDLAGNHSTRVAVTASTSAESGPGGASVAVGLGGGCAVTPSGGARCWGSYAGDGSITSPTVAVDVTGLASGVVAVTHGTNHACALTSAGAVTCWGERGGLGQLGDGVLTGESALPVNVLGLGSGVVAISGGYGPTCALTTIGEVWCWGGDGSILPVSVTLAERATPQLITGFTGTPSSLSVGERHACVVTTTGAAQCWGDNGAHQVGRPPGSVFRVPGTVTGLGSGVRSVSAGELHTCVVTTSDAALCWGRNFSGEAGNPQTGIWPEAPTPVTGLGSGVASVDAGTSHTCAVTTAGSVLCWGRNEVGELGTGDRVGSSSPRASVGLGAGSSWVVVTGPANSCALTRQTTVVCWGSHTFAPAVPDVPSLWLTL